MTDNVVINQRVAVLIDGNNIEMSLRGVFGSTRVINFDVLIPKVLGGRALTSLVYFREGKTISSKLADRIYKKYFGRVVPCHKSADIPLTIEAVQLVQKVDTIVIMSGDSDYIELVKFIIANGVRVEIASVKGTTSKALMEHVDNVYFLTEEDTWGMT